MSDILAIYAAIAATDVSITEGGDVIPVWNLAEVLDVVKVDHTPVRLLLPPGAGQGAGMSGYRPVSGTTAVITWAIQELLLYRSLGQGGGVAEVYVDLARYIARYVTTFNQNRRLAHAQITGFAPRSGVYEWPLGSGNEFHGVLMQINVDETIN